jgi:hypothetical protein
LQDEEELNAGLGAWVFFVRGDPNLGSMTKIIPTIAYQLARSQPDLRASIAAAARQYKDNYQSGSLEDQFELLIMKSLENAQAQPVQEQNHLAGVPVVLVFDALDEVSGDLVRLLKSLKKLVDGQDRFRVLVTTRPEPSIMHAFEQSGIDTRLKQVSMEEIDRAEADGDIRSFLAARFDRLRFNKELISAHPGAIAAGAGGLFVCARAVMGYLGGLKTPEVSKKRLTEIPVTTRLLIACLN